VYGYPNELWTLKRVEALIQQQRGDFLATLKGLPPADLVFLDETGSNLAMARDYARVPRGQRAYAPSPSIGCRAPYSGRWGSMAWSTR